MQKLLFVYYHSENRATSQIWKVLPNMVFPPIWGEKMAAFWACAYKLSWTLLSPARVQPLYGAGRKESSGTGLACLQLGRPLCFESKTQFFHNDIGIFPGNMLRARKYRFALCLRVLSNQYVKRSAYANVFKFNREKKRSARAKVNSRCFHWFPAAMLESLRRAPTLRLYTKHYNFQWHPLPNNSSSQYRTSPKLCHVVYYYSSTVFQFLDSIYWMRSDFIFYLRDN